MIRGEVWWAQLDPPAGRRPVLLVSRNDAYIARSLIMVAPVSTRIRGIAAEVNLGLGDGMPRVCAANLETLRTVSKARLVERITLLSPERLEEVDEALHFALGLTN
jgi:mRNA interferase MazF